MQKAQLVIISLVMLSSSAFSDTSGRIATVQILHDYNYADCHEKDNMARDAIEIVGEIVGMEHDAMIDLINKLFCDSPSRNMNRRFNLKGVGLIALPCGFLGPHDSENALDASQPIPDFIEPRDCVDYCNYDVFTNVLAALRVIARDYGVDIIAPVRESHASGDYRTAIFFHGSPLCEPLTHCRRAAVQEPDFYRQAHVAGGSGFTSGADHPDNADGPFPVFNGTLGRVGIFMNDDINGPNSRILTLKGAKIKVYCTEEVFHDSGNEIISGESRGKKNSLPWVRRVSADLVAGILPASDRLWASAIMKQYPGGGYIPYNLRLPYGPAGQAVNEIKWIQHFDYVRKIGEVNCIYYSDLLDENFLIPDPGELSIPDSFQTTFSEYDQPHNFGSGYAVAKFPVTFLDDFNEDAVECERVDGNDWWGHPYLGAFGLSIE